MFSPNGSGMDWAMPPTCPLPPTCWYLQTVSSSPPRPMLSPKRMRHSAKPWYMVSQRFGASVAAAKGGKRTGEWGVKNG